MSQALQHLAELDHIQAALPTLHLQHEALRLAWELREFNPRDTRRLPCRGDEADQLPMPLRENG